MASIRLPPYFDLDFGSTAGAFNFSGIDFDWEFFYTYVTIKTKDSILEVR